MEVLMLGTGSSDGWPNPWCAAPCCTSLVEAGILRTNTSALVDRVLLIDPGSEAPSQAMRQYISLAGVRYVLASHVHPDHLDPSFLMYRSWVNEGPLTVVGPKPVIEACKQWVRGGNVEFVTVTAGQDVVLGNYRVRCLPATHEAHGEALLYAIAGPDATILWGTDTGPWHPKVRPMLTGTRFDLVLLEETFGDKPDPTGGHHDLRTFATAVNDLRGWGCADGATDVVAIHLSHHNPAPELLYIRLRDLGARAVPDGTPIAVGGVRGSLTL
jgi:adenosylcobinamide kinase/adenosylcobinamide-phosphate guanylyltransferase